MNDLKYYTLHKNCKRAYVARNSNTVELNEEWSFDFSKISYDLKFVFNDLAEFLKESFDVNVGENTEKKIYSLYKYNQERDMVINISNDEILIVGNSQQSVIQAVYYLENLMQFKGDAVLDKGVFEFDYYQKPRVVSSALKDGGYTAEYLNILLHQGYNGVIVTETNLIEIELIRQMGFYIILRNNNPFYDDLKYFDGLIIDEIPCERLVNECKRFKTRLIYSVTDKIETLNMFDMIFDLPKSTVFLLSFDGGQELEKDGVKIKTYHSNLVMGQPSDDFISRYNLLKENNREIWVSNSASGKTRDFGGVPFVPAMMQWLLRNEAMKEYEFDGMIETAIDGLVPSIVSEFVKLQLFSPCEQSGVCLRKLVGVHYGVENTETAMLAVKKLSDAANCCYFTDIDRKGPLKFGPAYPLIDANFYKYPFEEKDVTLEIDLMLKAADQFEQAANIFASLYEEEPWQMRNICLFIANTLVTAANTKRWYRRLYAIDKTDATFKKKFLYDQLIKIGKEEIKNVEATLKLLEESPYLCGGSYSDLCNEPALKGKKSTLKKIIAEYKKIISEMQ